MKAHKLFSRQRNGFFLHTDMPAYQIRQAENTIINKTWIGSTTVTLASLIQSGLIWVLLTPYSRVLFPIEGIFEWEKICALRCIFHYIG